MSEASRVRKLKYNIFTSLMLQITTAVSGILLPRFILQKYGSDVNGLLSSITQFLGYITLLESGIGGVIKASLYKPLADKNYNEVSGVINACKNFFKYIAYIFIVYLIAVAIGIPFLPANKIFSFEFIFWLVLILGINVFMQYYFSISYQMLIQSDQLGYIVDSLQIFTIIGNMVIVIILIKFNFNIHIVKLGSAIVYLARPIFLNWYIKKHYPLSNKIEPNKKAISQRWDGLGHHIAYFVHKNTDIVILTVFSSLKEISIYSIYNMVVVNIQALVSSFSNAFSATLGNIISKQENILKRFFLAYETFLYVVSNIIFSVTMFMIVPFILIYTSGISDANYNNSIFALLIVISEYIYTVRGSYNNLVSCKGHFKQTKKYAFIEAGINIILSLIFVNKLGIVGVAIGTLIAMLFRLISFIWYIEKNIMQGVLISFMKNIIISIVSFLMVGILNEVINFGQITTFGMWVIKAAILTIMACIIQIILHLILNKKAFVDIYSLFKNRL